MNNRSLFPVILAVFFFHAAAAQNLPLQAWYPLNGSTGDSTGHFGPMTLTNTPFRPGGGIFCNGVYISSGKPNGSHAETPRLPITLFKGFTLSASFKVDSLPSYAMPILVGGDYWRWAFIELWSDGYLYLGYNSERLKANQTCSVGAWHSIELAYDSASGLATLSLDGTPVCNTTFRITHGDVSDRTFSTTNFGTGNTFTGTIRDIKLYFTPETPLDAARPDAAVSAASLRVWNYPDPFTSRTRIAFTLPEARHVSIRVFDLLGHEVGLLLDEERAAGEHQVSWIPDRLPSGLYVARLEAGSRRATRILSLQR